MGSPKVSVIIPCYNHGHYIAEAVDSVLAQTFQDFEIIITDDCSNDGTTPAKIKEIATKDKRIKVITLVENKGLPSARNSAIEKARGTYILPLDSDDKIAPSCLEKATDAMDAEKADIVTWNFKYFDASDEVKIISKTPEKIFPFHNAIPVCSLYKKSDWQKYGGYNDNMRKGFEDWDFWLCFLEDEKKFFILDEILFYYRVGHTSLLDSANKHRSQLKRQMRENHPKIYTFKNYYFTIKYFSLTFRSIRKKIIRLKFTRKEKIISILGFNLLYKKNHQGL